MHKFFRTPFAATGDRTEIPDDTDPSGSVSYQQGYGYDYQRPQTDPAVKNIERDLMNGLFYDLTTAIGETQARGLPDFITAILNGGAAFSYQKNAVLRYSDALYISLVDNNTAFPSDATKWARIDDLLASNAVQLFTNVASLRGVAPTLARRAQTRGYYTDGDGGAASYFPKTGAAPGTYVDNGATVIVPTGGDGSAAWLLDLTNGVSVKQTGAKGDCNGATGTDDTAAFAVAGATGLRVRVPSAGAGLGYRVANVAVNLATTDFQGESETGGTTIFVGTNGAGAFYAATGSYNLRLANMTIRSMGGVTNARAYKQGDKSTYTAYATFYGVETYLDLETAYDGFFIFASWEHCRDGYSGSPVGGQAHQFINSIPAAFGQGNQTNLNQVIKCQIFNASNSNGGVDIAYGSNWLFWGTDFEGGSARAVRARGIFGVAFQSCWFENLAAAEIVYADNSPAPNAQGTRPVSFRDCWCYCNAANTKFINAQGASSAGIDGLALANIPAGMVLTNVSSLEEMKNIHLLSGSYADFLGKTRPIQPSQAMTQNMLPIGPTGLGAANFTNAGFTAKADVASAIGLAGNAVRFTLSEAGNAAYYSLPAKIAKYLQGRDVTLVAWGYASSGAGNDNLRVAAWDSVGAPAYGNMTSYATSALIGVNTNTDLQATSVSFTVGAASTSLAVGFIAGGNANAQTVSIESMRLFLGAVNAADTPGLM